MPDRRSAESYGHADEYEDEYEDWDEQEALETVPEWLAALPQEDFELMSRGYLADIRGRFRVQGRIALEAERLQGEMELPPDRPGMTQAEEELYRIAMAAGRAAGEFVDESLRRHHDPDNPLRIDPTETHRVRDENDLETWRDQSILGLLQYCVQEARAGHTEQYGFAVMTGEAIECIREAVQDTPLVEIGAGNGWLARELNERGISVHPTDPAEIQRNDHALGGREHMPVERLDGFQALAKYPDHDLLWSWPQMHGYVPEVMKRFQGKHLVYIGENGYGCTGPREDIVVTMEGRYREAAWHALPSFPGVNDNLHILERIDYGLEPAGRDAAEYRADWPEHIGPEDLDLVLAGDAGQDLAGRIAEAAAREGRIPREFAESREEQLRLNMEFSLTHIIRCTVSDAMRCGDPRLRDQLEDQLLRDGTEEREWAEARVKELAEMAQPAAAGDPPEGSSGGRGPGMMLRMTFEEAAKQLDSAEEDLLRQVERVRAQRSNLAGLMEFLQEGAGHGEQSSREPNSREPNSEDLDRRVLEWINTPETQPPRSLRDALDHRLGEHRRMAYAAAQMESGHPAHGLEGPSIERRALDRMLAELGPRATMHILAIGEETLGRLQAGLQEWDEGLKGRLEKGRKIIADAEDEARNSPAGQ